MEAGVTVCVEEGLVNFIFLPHTHTLTHASTHFSTSHSHTHPRLYPSTLPPSHSLSFLSYLPLSFLPYLPPIHPLSYPTTLPPPLPPRSQAVEVQGEGR